MEVIFDRAFLLSMKHFCVEASVTGWKNMMDVNVIALCLCTKEAVGSMRQRGVDDGQIIHISRYETFISTV